MLRSGQLLDGGDEVPSEADRAPHLLRRHAPSCDGGLTSSIATPSLACAWGKFRPEEVALCVVGCTVLADGFLVVQVCG